MLRFAGHRFLQAFFATVIASVGMTARGAAPTWPQWRGPTRDGVVVAEKPWPAKLGEQNLIRTWHVDVGQGYSSPTVAADRVFTVETASGIEIVRAFDRAGGKQLWESRWEGSMMVPFFALKNGSWVRSTPAYDGRFLYVGGMRDVLACLDGADGTVKWRVDFVERYKSPLPAFGFVSSPLVKGDHLYVQVGASVLKLDKKTGQTVWRALEDGGGMWNSAFSSPMIATIGEAEQLVVLTRTVLAGVDVASGKVLWSEKIPAFRGMNIINPVILGDRIFTSSYGGGSFLFQVIRDGEKWSVKSIWKNKIEGNMSTPAVIDGHVYLHGRDKEFHCLDLATGQEKWKSGERFGEYWSLVVQGKMILALDQRGELLLIEASSEKLQIVDRRRVGDQETWAHVAVCGPEVWVRQLKGISRWDWK